MTVVERKVVRQHVTVDQGLAAVLGAGVGVVGTLGTACLTYLATRHQTKDQERVEHGQWLRQQRQHAYEDFLVAYERFAGAAAAMEDALQGQRIEALEELAVTLADATEDFSSARVRVAVAGPHFASQSAGQIAILFHEVRRYLLAWREAQMSGDAGSEMSDQLQGKQGKIQLAYRDFVRDARSILESPSPATSSTPWRRGTRLERDDRET
ncbi:hypothetical protein [Streptomyces sp. NBC_00063]|uniref:hypothetical protein n=1 Tax=Streptomyces sp. NBC_00063 TaxID=2975638 RepID=UPI0022554451|nr:hypothetical protein [Streptomyces sp. NBC_00063]MCX5441183.1 hypothetical protein [Streptomyces sp. NBC_00063]